MENYKIVLASASPRRQELLSQIGLSFVVCPSHREERVTKTAPEQIVQELSAQKAEDIRDRMMSDGGADVRDGGSRSPKAGGRKDFPVLVIGADTIVACDGQIMGKPKDRADACRMLSMLQGRSHQVYTGVTVIGQGFGGSRRAQPSAKECGFSPDGQAAGGSPQENGGSPQRNGFWEERFTFYECTQVEFFPMSREEIDAYVETGEPMDKAGAYGIQGRCAAYIKGIHGDYNNVVGLPVGRLYQELHERGLL